MPEETTAEVQELDRPTPSEDSAEETTDAQPEKAGGENADPQANAKEAGEQKDNEEQKRRGGWQRQRDKARREAEAARQEAEYWKQQVIGRQSPQQSAKPEAAKAKPKPEDFRIEGTDTYDVAAFTEALTEYKAEQKIAEAETRRQEAEARRQAETEQQRIAREYQERTTKVSEARKDFSEKSETCLDTLQEIAPDPAKAPAGARVIGDAILRNDPDGELEYYLGSNPEEIERIAELDPTAAAIEIGKLFAKFATEKTKAEEADEEDEPPAPVVTKAPPPLTPTRKPSPSARPFDPSDPRNDKDMSFEEWNKRDMERRRRR